MEKDVGEQNPVSPSPNLKQVINLLLGGCTIKVDELLCLIGFFFLQLVADGHQVAWAIA